MTILLTGPTGFVGRQVLRSLLDQGSRVRVLVRTGKEKQVPVHASIDSIVTSSDIFSESTDWWSNVCLGIDTAIHVAWYAEPGKYLESRKNIDCLLGTLRFATGSVQAGVRRFVGIGTCFEYDLAQRVLSVDTPLRPTTPYAAAKAAVFTALSQWLPREGLEFAWCRLFYLYGAGEDARRLTPYLRSRLSAGQTAELTSGTQLRDFLDVSDAGRIIAAVALSRKQGPVNVCSGVPVTVRQFAERIAQEYGRPDLLRFGARPDNLVDPPCVLGIP